MNTTAMFSSKTCEWETPIDFFFKELDAKYHFSLDVCATKETALRGGTVVCLLPARTDTAWWHDYCMKGEITFIRGRLKFGGCSNPAPFPSAIVVFKPNRR